MTPRELFPQPKPLEGGPICHESFVNFSIRVSVLVRLISPRAFSSRQGVGTRPPAGRPQTTPARGLYPAALPADISDRTVYQEVKPHLCDLPGRVEKGERILITKRGEPAA